MCQIMAFARSLVQGNGGMAKKPTTTKNLDSDVAKELENALDLDLTAMPAAISTSRPRWRTWRRRSRRPRTSWCARARNAPAVPAASQPSAEASTGRSKPPDRSGRRRRPRPDCAPVETANQPATGFAPANDDRQKDFRTLLHSLNRRASSTVYWVAALAVRSGWLGAAPCLADLPVRPGHLADPHRSTSCSTAPELDAARASARSLPVILFWAFAVMIRRAQEMRLAAQSMTEVAFRLAEPENLAQDRVMMVGQAVRREVAAMGEGIERTLARAVELETLVHTEVNQIERSYSENAARIRALVDGLGSEREAVVTHAERVRASITGAHETLRDEIGSASDIIRD